MRFAIEKQAKIFGVKVENLDSLYIVLKSGEGRSRFLPYSNKIEFYEGDLKKIPYTKTEELCHFISNHEISSNTLPYLTETTPPIVCGPERSLSNYLIRVKSEIVPQFVKNPKDLRFYFGILLRSNRIDEMESIGYTMADLFSEYFLVKHTPKELLDFLKTIPDLADPLEEGLTVEEFVRLFNEFTKQKLTVEDFFKNFSNYFKSQIAAGAFLKPPLVPQIPLKNMSLPSELLAEERLMAEIMEKAAKDGKFLKAIKNGKSFTFNFCGKIIKWAAPVISGVEAFYEVTDMTDANVPKKIATFPQYWLVNFFELGDIGQPIRDLQEMADETYRLEKDISESENKQKSLYLNNLLQDRLKKECSGPTPPEQPYSACESKIRKEIRDLESKMRREEELKNLVGKKDFLNNEEAIIEFYKIYPGGFIEYYKNPIRWFLRGAKNTVQKINSIISQHPEIIN
jgi:hypothetical protein